MQSSDAFRQILNISPSPPSLPPAPSVATDQPGHGPPAREDPPPPPQPADFLVDIVGNLLSNRPDAADIVVAIAHRLSLPATSFAVQVEQPGHHHSTSAADEHAQRADLSSAVRVWQQWVVHRHRLREIVTSVRSRRLEQSATKLILPGATPTASTLAVKAVGERSWLQRDAELRLGALPLSSSSPPPDSPISSAPTHRHCDTSSAKPLLATITADALPPEFEASPSYLLVGQVLRSTLDFTNQDWRTRAFYEPAALAAYHRWSDPAGQPHRDASDALAELSDPEVLGVPHELLSANPDVSAEAWDHCRLVWTHALHRAFAAGVDWLRALRAMSLVYSDPEAGHPRIHAYIMSAMTDRVLVHHPLLHAYVLRFKLDTSFAAGSTLYSKESRTVDWDRATERLPGEDIVTLATRVAEAYLKKISDPAINMMTVWKSSASTRDITERFHLCILADSASKERANLVAYEFIAELGRRTARVQRGDSPPSELNIIVIAEHLQHIESAAVGRKYDLADIDDSSSESSSIRPTRRYGTTGRGARTRRAERRALLGPPAP